MGESYSHLTLEERCRLQGMIEMGLPKTEMARRLGRHRSTIYRELDRNSNVTGYRPDGADRLAWARKLRGSQIERSTRLRGHVEDRLAMGWSPEQIAGRMELEGLEHTVCAESIYRRSTVRPGAVPACRASSRSERRGGAGGDAAAPASRRSRTAFPSTSGRQRRICAPSSGTGRET